MLKSSLKYIFSLPAIMLVMATFAVSHKASATPAQASVASMLRDYDCIQGEIRGLQQRVKKIEADIDTLDTDLTEFDSRMGVISDSMIQLRRTCGDYLVLARKLRKTAPEISIINSQKKICRSIRRNGYINADIVSAHRQLRSLTDRYFSIFNEKERIRYLVDHESDLYAMVDNLAARIDMLGKRSDDAMSLISPRRNEAEAILARRIANAKGLDKEMAGTYIVRINRSRQSGTQSPDSCASVAPVQSKMGAMMFPVSGKYNIVGWFGRYPHPEFDHITVFNPGIDIEAGSGAKARAVLPGKVEGVFDIPGYSKVVVVSHGDYSTVYGNLTDIKVAQDMDIKDGQIVGSVVADSGHTVLHFEVRLGTDPIDPAMWLRL